MSAVLDLLLGDTPFELLVALCGRLPVAVEPNEDKLTLELMGRLNDGSCLGRGLEGREESFELDDRLPDVSVSSKDFCVDELSDKNGIMGSTRFFTALGCTLDTW